jgi:hypothetical protein
MAAYVAGVYGQGPIWGLAWGGWITSNGVTRTVQRTKAELGYDGDCYNFNQMADIHPVLRSYQEHQHPISMLCYSLGVTTGTAYQLRYSLDLLICVAGSELGNNYPISQVNTKRSVLIRGSGIMSAWGKDAGFTKVYDLDHVPHLLMDFHPDVIRICESEFATLVKK